MTIVLIPIVSGLAAGLWMIFDIHPADCIRALWTRPQTLRQRLLEIQGIRRENFVQKQFRLARETLEMTGRAESYRRYRQLAILFAVIGAGLGAVMLNPFVAAVLALAGLLGPLFAVQASASSFQLAGRADMYAAMSLVTSAVDRTGDPVTAVEENIRHMGAPMQAIFKEFQRRYNLDSSVPAAVAAIRSLMDQDVWRAWCDALLQCYNDPSRVGALREITQTCARQNSIQVELASILKKPFRDVRLMIAIVALPIPAMCLIFPATMQILFGTLQGKIAVAAVAAAVLHAAYRAVRAARPLELGKAAGL